jgi:hypothetical protein
LCCWRALSLPGASPSLLVRFAAAYALFVFRPFLLLMHVTCLGIPFTLLEHMGSFSRMAGPMVGNRQFTLGHDDLFWPSTIARP